MLSLRSRCARQKARCRKFSPSDPLSEREARLEGRTVAAPALWMQPFPPLPFANVAWSTVDGYGLTTAGLIDVQIHQAASGLYEGLTSGTLVNDIPTQIIPTTTGGVFTIPGVTYTMLGTGHARVDDYANPGNGSGFANIGNFGVSAFTTSNLSWTTVGNIDSPVVFATLQTESDWSRAYFLADSSAAPAGSPPGTVDTYSAPLYLQETFTANYFPPNPNAPVTPGGGVGLDTGPTLVNGAPNGGLSIRAAVAGQILSPAAVTVGGFTIPVAPDLTGAYSTLYVNPTTGLAATVSGTTTSLRVVESYPITSLPYTTSGGVVTGPTWYATGGGGIAAPGDSSAVLVPTGGMSLSTTYAATFMNAPVTTISTVPWITPPPMTPPPSTPPPMTPLA